MSELSLPAPTNFIYNLQVWSKVCSGQFSVFDSKENWLGRFAIDIDLGVVGSAG